ncbi:O-antigen ligase [uncultured Microbacterium sp.]|uniref:O-antigen ligase family protein n=1 Tax=uncultured Microbacterium sp. TaxID=191216 RepID=UPI0025E1A0DE|nr:O-antigen ligase family protein [uncultured Microbacterium sp.]
MTNALVYMAAFSSSWTAAAFGGFNVVDYLLAAAVVSMVVSRISGRREIRVRAWTLLPFIAAVIISGYDAILVGDAVSPVTDLVRILISTAVVATLLGSVASTSGRTALRRALGWWAAGIGVSSLASGTVSLGLVSFAGILIQPTGLRLSGLSSHPNSIAFSITMALPVVIYFMTTARSFLRAVWWIGVLAACLWGLILADSRSGLLVTIPAVAIALTLAMLHSRLRLLSIPILVVAGILAYTFIPDAVAETRLVQGSAQSDAGRVIYNDDALRTFFDSPVLGGGFDAQAGVAVLLMVLSAGGIVLLLGYYLFVFWPIPTLWRARRDRLAQTGLLSVFVFLGFGLLNPVFVERATFWPVLVAFMGLAAARDRETISRGRTTRSAVAGA